jgi:anti-anti-sigma regulatory factor
MIVKLRKYGSILTGRPFGQKVLKELESSLDPPVTLDFEGAISMGSAFGDEVVAVIAKRQGGEISVVNANRVVWSCLDRLAEDHGITIKKADGIRGRP